MGLVLTIDRIVVPAAERDRQLERLRRRREHFTRAGCRFWVFEEAEVIGAFVEFIEAADLETLDAALTGAPGTLLEIPRVYQEVEL